MDEGSSKQINVIDEQEAQNLIKELKNFHIENPDVNRIKYRTQ